jgi:hypothetical protein
MIKPFYSRETQLTTTEEYLAALRVMEGLNLRQLGNSIYSRQALRHLQKARACLERHRTVVGRP